jgi:hypothetical protein
MGLEHFNYLLGVLKKYHGVQNHIVGNKFSGMDIEWDYAACRFSISMPGYICCFSNSSIHTLPNHGYLHVNVSPSSTTPNLTSHLILTLQNLLMLAANAEFKKLFSHFFNT